MNIEDNDVSVLNSVELTSKKNRSEFYEKNSSKKGLSIECKVGNKAVLRMLYNNLDPEVAERPEDLVVYGGIGKAARNWEAFEAIENVTRIRIR